MTTLWTEITWLLKISCVALIGLGYEWKWIFPLATHGSYPGRKRISAHRTPASLIIMHTGSQVTQLQLPLSPCWLSDCFYSWSESESVEDQQVSWISGQSHVEKNCIWVLLVLCDVFKTVCTRTVTLARLIIRWCLHFGICIHHPENCKLN